MAGPWEEWALVGLSNWVSGAGAVSSDSLSAVGGGGGRRVLLGLSQGEAFVLENIHPYPLVIGLACSLWLGTAPDRIPFLYTSNTK